jgi:phosphatidylinositol N-acetylglucosaminyltransferase subunit Y
MGRGEYQAQSLDVDENSLDESVEELFKTLGLRRFGQACTSPNVFVAYTVLVMSVLIGTAYFYAAVVSNFVPDTGIYFLDAIKKDQYFCFLAPLTILPIYVFAYVNWLSMTFFENN